MLVCRVHITSNSMENRLACQSGKLGTQRLLLTSRNYDPNVEISTVHHCPLTIEPYYITSVALISPVKQPLTDTLCTQCGLCCDGSLFADVELAGGNETSALEVLGLNVEDAEDDIHGLLLQPCGALKEKRCSIYAHRPNCCRT